MIYRSVAILVMAFCAIAARAVIIVTPGPGSFDNDENILFNEEGLLDDGPVVEGITNQTRSIVVFSEAGEDLTTPAGGQARIESLNDNGFASLMMTLENPGLGFSTLIWNLNALEDGTVTFTIQGTGSGTVQQTFDLDRAGENFFRIEALGERMTSVRFEADVDLRDVRQIRVGVVPEPSALGAIGVGLASLLMRRKRRWRLRWAW